MSAKTRPLFDPPLVRRAAVEAFAKLDPRYQLRNPVMFVVFVGSILTSLLWVYQLAQGSSESPWFVAGISV